MVKAILFDFDGVIIDSSKTTLRYFKEAIANFGYPIPTERKIKSCFGLKTREMFKQLFPNLNPTELEKLYNYSKQLSIRYASQIPLVPGALVVIKKLNATYKLAIVTSRGKESVEILQKKYNLDKYFKIIVDREDVQNHKPHPEPILKALRCLGVINSEAVYIGDTESDVGAAHNANMPCIIISRSKECRGADYHIESIKELLGVIRNIA